MILIWQLVAQIHGLTSWVRIPAYLICSHSVESAPSSIIFFKDNWVRNIQASISKLGFYNIGRETMSTTNSYHNIRNPIRSKEATCLFNCSRVCDWVGLKTFFYIWCLLTNLLLVVRYHFTTITSLGRIPTMSRSQKTGGWSWQSIWRCWRYLMMIQLKLPKYFQMKYCRVPLFASLLCYLLIFLAAKYPPYPDGLHRVEKGDDVRRGRRGRTLQVLVRPEEKTVLAEPAPNPCRDQQVNLVVAVVSAPAHFLARSVIRWASHSYQHSIQP